MTNADRIRKMMTENEAIEMLEIQKPVYGCKKYQQPLMHAYEMAIKALEDIQKYRSIGTPEECRCAVEKQKAKTPDFEGVSWKENEHVL